jgi:hypothetical protein
MRNFIFIALYIALIGIAGPSFAGCTVPEMLKMAKGGSGKSVITEKCDGEVDDAPRCSFSRVLQLALAKKAEYAIREECDACDHPRCEADTVNFSCSLGSKAPKGIKEGDECHCFLQMGPIMGTVSCNN